MKHLQLSFIKYSVVKERWFIMGKRGRKLKNEINKDIFENLCGIQCTLVDIADAFGCSEDTIERWCKKEYGMLFSEIYSHKSVAGRISLRRNMFKMAESNVTMAIWLSKQHLGMKDVVETESKVDNKIEIVWEDAPTDED